MNRIASRFSRALLAAFSLSLLHPGTVRAVDGVIEIDVTRVAAGGITPGDMPGLPVTITLPGSYLLTGDLIVKDGAVPARDTNAIEVVTVDVSIDLNGFAIIGKTTCVIGVCDLVGVGVGVDASAGENTSVYNGVVRGMGGHGLVLGSSSAAHRLVVLSNGLTGIISRTGSAVTECVVVSNGASGIVTQDDAVVVSGNVVEANRLAGIAVEAGATVEANVVAGNGDDGIVAFGASLLDGNVAIGNDRVGLRLDASSGILRNLSSANDDADLVGGVSLGANLCGAALCVP